MKFEHDRILDESLAWLNQVTRRRLKSDAPGSAVRKPYQLESYWLVISSSRRVQGRAYRLTRFNLMSSVSQQKTFLEVHSRAVLTIAFKHFSKQRTLLYVFFDHLEGFGIKGLTHRITILEVSESLSKEGLCQSNLLHSGNYDCQGSGKYRDQFCLLIARDLIKVASLYRTYTEINWLQQVELSRSIVMGAHYTKASQAQAQILYATRLQVVLKGFEGAFLSIPTLDRLAKKHRSKYVIWSRSILRVLAVILVVILIVLIWMRF